MPRHRKRRQGARVGGTLFLDEVGELPHEQEPSGSRVACLHQHEGRGRTAKKTDSLPNLELAVDPARQDATTRRKLLTSRRC